MHKTNTSQRPRAICNNQSAMCCLENCQLNYILENTEVILYYNILFSVFGPIFVSRDGWHAYSFIFQQVQYRRYVWNIWCFNNIHVIFVPFLFISIFILSFFSILSLVLWIFDHILYIFIFGDLYHFIFLNLALKRK